MKTISEYLLYEGATEDYYKTDIPDQTKLILPKNSQVLSVLAERNSKSFSIKAYVEENGDGEQVTKRIALVRKAAPEGDGLGWKFLNSLVVSTGPEAHPTITPYHAYVKIC
jgi:hypothetical protein